MFLAINFVNENMFLYLIFIIVHVTLFKILFIILILTYINYLVYILIIT